MVVGRRKQCDIALDDPSISGKHCRIEGAEDGWQIQDLGSTNGVFVNGQRTTEATLGDGDALRLGTVTLQFALADLEASAPLPTDGREAPAEPAMVPGESPGAENEAREQKTQIPAAEEPMPPVRSLPKLRRPRPLLIPLVLCILVLALGVLGWILSQHRNGGTDDNPDPAATTSQQLDGEDAPSASGQDPALPPQDPESAQTGPTDTGLADRGAGVPDVEPIDQDTYVLASPSYPPTERHGAVVAFSQDLRLAITRGAEETLLVRNLSTPARTVELAGYHSSSALVAFSPSGDRVATAMLDGKVQIWSTSTGKELRTWQRKKGWAARLFFSHDGELLVTIARSSLEVRNTRTGQEAELSGLDPAQGDLMAQSADGASVLLERHNTFVIRNLKTQEERAYTPGSGSQPGYGASAISPDLSVVAQARTRLRVMHIAEQSHTTSESFLGGRRGSASAMDLSPGGAYLLIGSKAQSGGSEGDVVVWDIAEKRPCWSFRGGKSRSGRVTAVAFDPDMKRILAAYQDGKIRVWERAAAGPKAPASAGIPSGFTAVTPAPGGYHLNFPLGQGGREGVEMTRTRSFSADASRTAWSHDWAVHVADTGTGAELLKVVVPRDDPPITSIALSPDGKILAIGNRHCIVEVFEVDTGRDILRLTGHDNLQKALLTGEILGDVRVQFIRGSDRFVSHAMSGKRHVLRLWNTETGKSLLTIKGTRGAVDVSPVIAFAADSSGAKLLAGTKEFGLYDVETGRQLSTFAGHDATVGGGLVGKYPITRLALSESHSHVASWVQADKMKVWDSSGKELLSFPWASPWSAYGWWVSQRPRADRLGRIFGPKDKSMAGNTPAGQPRDMLNQLMRQEPWWVESLAGTPGNKIRVRKWNGQQVVELATLSHGEATYTQASASADGARFGTLARTNAFTADLTHWARAWDVASGKELRKISDHSAYLSFVAFGGNGDCFLSWQSGYMYVWGPPPDFLLAAQRPLPKDHVVWGFTEDGMQIVSGTKLALSDPDFVVKWKTEFKVWDALTGTEISIDRKAPLGVRATDGHPELKRVVAVTGARRGKATGPDLLRFVDSRAPKVTSPDGRRTAVVAEARAASIEQAHVMQGNRKTVLLQRSTTGELLHTLQVEQPLTAAFSADSRTVAVGGGNGVVTLFDVETGDKRAELTSNAAGLGCLCITPDGKYVLAASTDRTLVVWDVASRRRLLKAYLFLQPACALRLLPGGRVIASATNDGHIRFWDLQRLLAAVER
ncbi:MAG: FHA domain-containing protein [Victivallales bacterium]|nr:FHA domain-containing protein [Victivallales bacterium]